MNRRTWLGAATLVMIGVGAAAYTSPWFHPVRHLRSLSAAAILRRAQESLDTHAFAETLTYRNGLLPPEINAAALLNLPLPDAGVRTVVLFQASPSKWRLEEMNDTNTVAGVVARRQDQLITYLARNNQRTVESLPNSMETPWTIWPIPTADSYRNSWAASVRTRTYAGQSAYEVSLRPKAQDTLMGSVTYWFDGQNFLPIGVRVTDRQRATVFAAKLTNLRLGSPGSAANPPTGGKTVAWRVSSTLAKAAGNIAAPPSKPTAYKFPAALGPLRKVSERDAGGTALAVYGHGVGRVVVLDTSARIFKGEPGAQFFRPIAGAPNLKGVTDGIFSVVTFHQEGREITLMGSRSQAVLAKWAKTAWQ